MIEHTPSDTTDEIEEALNADELKKLKQKSVAGALSYFLRTLFLNGIGIVTALILSAYFSAEDFGIYGYVTQFIGLLVFFADIGLAASLIQKKSEPSLTDYRTAFTIQQILSWGIVVAVLVLYFSGLVQAKTGDAGGWVLLALGFSFPLAALKTISAIQLERELLFSKLVIPQIVEQLVFNVVLILLAFQDFGVIAYAYAIMIRSILGAVVMIGLKPWSIGFAFDRQSAKTLLNFGAKFQLNDLLARIKDQLFFIVLAMMMPLRDFGYIQWSKNWSMYPYNLTVQNVMAITFPTFSRLQHNKDALKKAIEKSLFFITLLIFPILVGMSVFIYPLTQVVDRYQKWEPAIVSFVLFTLGIGWSAISSPLTNALNAIGKINLTLRLMLIWTGLTWTVTPVLFYWIGFNGVAWASLLIACTSFLPVIEIKKLVEIDVWGNIWRQLMSAVIMGVVGVLGISLWSQTLLHLLLGMGVVSAVYLVTLGLVGWQKVYNEVKSLRR